ncbi:GNAT family N-acetyltransferase [Fulvivirga lutea]|uniref:GNAT family N-acetyltransferase n=1 Tax=Fulvivirga lutea TaxID=2810512 RepID=A0A974WGZ8_9BACT|nr:N-acetyltransferase [Fulvivirga lutea]QSE97042.1 GNAT family N-acetyltransferase [Fulvivirga lutea]
MTNTKSNIRPYKSEDFDQLISIFKLNTPTYFDPKEVVDFENYLIQEPDNHYVIESDGEVKGCCGYKIDDRNSGHITWIFFHPDTQGKGMGQKIVNFCLDKIAEQANVHSVVVRTSQLAHKFFEKFDFKLEYIKNDFWGKGLDLYYMTKETS